MMLTPEDIDDVLDYLCLIATKHYIYYLWRSFLRDTHDDMVLELAVSAECPFIVTHNLGDFSGIERFGVQAVASKLFLNRIGALG